MSFKKSSILLNRIDFDRDFLKTFLFLIVVSI